MDVGSTVFPMNREHCIPLGDLADTTLHSDTAFPFRYTPIEIPKSILVQTRNAKGPPTTRTKRVISRKDWCSRARDKLNLSSRLVDSPTVGKYSELVGHSGGRYVGEAVAGHPHGVCSYTRLFRGQYISIPESVFTIR